MQKKFLEIEESKAVDGERAIWFTASTSDRDRDGDVVDQDGWKLAHFKKNPVFLWAHDSRRPPIGKVVDIKNESGKLKLKVEFVPAEIDAFAEQVYQLYKGGFLKAVSVGFMVYKSVELTEEERKARPEITWGRRLFAELLELSAVPVPANPQALAGKNAKEFAEVVNAGFSGKSDDSLRLDLIPYEKDGKVSEPMLKASLAVLLGARSGPALDEDATRAHIAKLCAVAAEAGIEIPEIKAYSADELRTVFDDVWGNEVLDVCSLHEDERLNQNSKKNKSKEDEARLDAVLVAAKDMAIEASQTIKKMADFMAARRK